jgi:hypothetical protein
MPSFPAAHPRALRRQNLGKLQSPARHRNRNACHPERTRGTSHNLATSRKFRLRAIWISIKSYRSSSQSAPPSLGRALSDQQSDSGRSKPAVRPKQRLGLSIWCAEDVTLRRHHHIVIIRAKRSEVEEPHSFPRSSRSRHGCRYRSSASASNSAMCFGRAFVRSVI